MRFFILLLLVHNIVYAHTNIDYAQLENGMKIYVIENHHSPIVNHMLLYRVGGESSPMGESGLAHFLEHLMFCGTYNIKDITEIIHKNGGIFNASTNHYYTNYYETVTKDKLGLMMQLEADRMRGLQITEDAVRAERDIVMEERRMRIDNNPAAQLEEEMFTAFFHNYYGWQVVGWPREILSLDKKKADFLYDNFYHPNNAVLIVTGDTTMKEVLPLAREYYGVKQAVKIPKIITVEEPEHKTDVVLTMRNKEVKKPELRIWYKAPNINSHHAAPLQLAKIILSNSRASHLYQKLVIGEKVIGISVDYEPFTNVSSIFEISVIPKGNNVEVDKLVTDLIDEISTKGVSAQDLIRAKKMFKASWIYAMESPIGQASLYSKMIMLGFDLKRIRDIENAVDHITVEQVNMALKEVLYKKNKVIGYLLPEELENENNK